MKAVFLGRATLDLSYVVHGFPSENEKIFSEAFCLQPGGPALNAAITFSILGGEGTIISYFGNGAFGSLVKKQAADQYGLAAVDLAEDQPYDLPVSSIIIHPAAGSRTILNTPRQAVDPAPCRFDPSGITTPRLVLIDGYNLEGRRHWVEGWKRQGAVIVLDGGSWKEMGADVLPLVDCAICSDRFSIPGLDRERTIAELHRLGVARVAFTRDREAIIVSEDGETKWIPVPQVNAVDTLGAGDVLHGAFCYYYLENRDFARSLELAAGIAGKSCQYYGTHTWAERR
jgi:sugar/nucleoside kinase (ribokinase family)